ncbi:glutamate-5-semialdehyde dehydrogenase [Thalassomonas sp. M1454]|uniref:glutamate-5-semialdehyde dehydrogenase n=1 Tax=Thalassomonas sp. M1454 TaxID=2594477 RepID=UPI00117C3CFA|nr:glutamate-5-semialdehyde dehydrogenase [Thalassomonas sp. M1454]TRX58047.1 glutamate-5-semialdehyde dehydrogenase [Thalassomonas sp. M1454]
MSNNINAEFDIALLAKKARKASLQAAQLDTNTKNKLLLAMAENIKAEQAKILNENAKDISAGEEKGLSTAMLDRLLLNPERINDIADAIVEIANLADPVGSVSPTSKRPSGIEVAKMRIPLGVIAMIYEARPNVTAEAAALCLKSGNGVILRGGSEALHSNLAIAQVLHKTLVDFNLLAEVISVVPNPDRIVIEKLLTLNQDIDLVIPRGGEGLIRYVSDNSRIPVIQHFKGVCHLYVDKYADLDKAIDILVNGKTQRPSACNSLETVLVHQDVSNDFLSKAAVALAPFKVKVHACNSTIGYFENAELATDADYDAEYLAQEIAVKQVDDFEQAIAHIQQFSSDHTEVIVTQDYSRSREFVRRINSSVVMVNASSRFSDGGELGLGSEIGISTSKLHAYGPMGLEALTTEKFVVFGEGEVRS